jgi:hypothetical protein
MINVNYFSQRVATVTNLVLLGRAGMNHDGGICTCDEALGVPRALGYEANIWIVSSSQARTSGGRRASFGLCLQGIRNGRIEITCRAIQIP